ncbi:MAG: hypothetical protein AB1486_05720 [Planctomycetota bacterium]
MFLGVSHDRDDETIEAKARWFQSLTLQECMRVFSELTDLILANCPTVMEQKDAQPVEGRVRVLSRVDLIRSKRAAGRPVDLEDIRILELGDKPPESDDQA